METKRSAKPPLGRIPTAHDVSPASIDKQKPGKSSKRRPKPKPARRSKAAVTIGPGLTSTRDIWLDKA